MEANTYKPDTSNFQNGRVEIHVPISMGLTPHNVCACSMLRPGDLFVFDGLGCVVRFVYIAEIVYHTF
jgi:hypothetical protein